MLVSKISSNLFDAMNIEQTAQNADDEFLVQRPNVYHGKQDVYICSPYIFEGKIGREGLLRRKGEVTTKRRVDNSFGYGKGGMEIETTKDGQSVSGYVCVAHKDRKHGY